MLQQMCTIVQTKEYFIYDRSSRSLSRGSVSSKFFWFRCGLLVFLLSSPKRTRKGESDSQQPQITNEAYSTMTIIYALISRAQTVLAEYTATSGKQEPCVWVLWRRTRNMSASTCIEYQNLQRVRKSSRSNSIDWDRFFVDPVISHLSFSIVTG